MRLTTLPTVVALLVVAALSHAQLVDPVSQPFERALDDSSSSNPLLLTQRNLLEARQSPANSTNATSASTTASAAESTASGSAPPGGEATITESTCSETNHLSINQQASWGNGFVNTCCGFEKGSQCWYRNQDMVSGQDECEIPDCAALESEDKARMIGFIPLNSTNGSGKYGNIFLSLGMLSAGFMVVPAMGLMLAISAAVVTMSLV